MIILRCRSYELANVIHILPMSLMGEGFILVTEAYVFMGRGGENSYLYL